MGPQHATWLRLPPEPGSWLMWPHRGKEEAREKEGGWMAPTDLLSYISIFQADTHMPSDTQHVQP